MIKALFLLAFLYYYHDVHAMDSIDTKETVIEKTGASTAVQEERQTPGEQWLRNKLNDAYLDKKSPNTKYFKVIDPKILTRASANAAYDWIIKHIAGPLDICLEYDNLDEQMSMLHKIYFKDPERVEVYK